MEEVKKIGWGNVKKCDVHIEVLFNGDLMIFLPHFDPDANLDNAVVHPDVQRGMKQLQELLCEIYDVCQKHGRTMIW